MPVIRRILSNCPLSTRRTFHDLYRSHLIRGEYRDKKRPVLINNWEATYFDFNEEKLLSIAKEASALGIEMLVMDDGWFGNRFDDNGTVFQKQLGKFCNQPLLQPVNAQHIAVENFALTPGLSRR